MKKLYRSRNNKMISGVLGGLGEFSQVDPTVLRLVFLVITIFTAVIPCLILYFLAASIVPMAPEGPKQAEKI